MDTTADLTAQIAIFGVDAMLNGLPVRGIFENAYADAFNQIGGTLPIFSVKASLNPLRGQSLIIGPTTYTVTHVDPDGEGLCTLRLEKV